MKIFFLLIILLIPFIPGVAKSDSNEIFPNNKRIEYVGRWDKSDSGNYHSYWGGAYFEIKFYGQQVNLKFSAPVNVFVKIDHHQEILYLKANGLIQITPDTLGNGVHEIQVIAKFQNDEIQLAGLFLNEGAKLLKPQKRNKWVEFIGDSITSGDRTSKGNISAYPWLTGELLNVKHTQISYCGITLTNGYHYQYKEAPKIGMDSAYFNLKQPNSQPPNLIYHTKQEQPNLIVINLGTNDSHLNVPSSIFESHYINFIDSLRRTNPKSTIALLMPFNGAYQNEILDMVHDHFSSWTNLKVIETKGWLKPDDFSDGTHPKDKGHEIIAGQLTGILKAYLD
jgi:hypothetical protein